MTASGQAIAFKIRATLVAWERLRLLFNLVVAAIFLCTAIPMLGPQHLESRSFWIRVAFWGLVANICYLCGPGIDLYLQALGCRIRGLRVATFILGTLLCGLLAFMFVFTTMMRDFD